MVKHEFSNASSTPIRMGEYVGNVSFVIRNVGDHECKADDQVSVKYNASEIGIIQAFGN